ncbi:hypothetical protein Slin14017_G036140 [Septoria linicola]|nr:hypothetical protein Slin14017_G036140 [Septoria linicola]
MAAVPLRSPLPDVAAALEPYIKTRQEVDQIRRGVQASLPVSSLDPYRLKTEDRAEDGGLTGVRKAYLRALQAHRAAQERYDSLKTELDQLSRDGTGPAAQQDTSFLAETYVPLVRQREKCRKLAIIDKTLSTITTTAGDSVSDSFDKVAKREAGELPHPPSTAGYADRELGSDADYDLTRLKKAILSMQHEIQEHKQASAQANGIADTEVNPLADLKALQKTHSELTSWMEKQLAMIGDVDSTKDGSSSTYSATDPSSGEEAGAFSITDIESLYEQYLDSRQRLLEIVSNQDEEQESSTPSSPDTQRRSSAVALETEGSLPSTAELLLPYLSRLSLAKQTEQALLQQSGYVRRRTTAAEAQTQEITSRLADESHLVQPEHRRGAPQGRDWRRAAEEASDAIATVATKRLQSGKAAADSAARSLQAIQGMPASVETLSR